MANGNMIESAIERLTDLCSDMKVMIAAHEQRIQRSEEDTQVIFKLLEQRRKEIDEKIDQVYEHMTEKDDKILSELKAHREASAKEHEALRIRLAQTEKFIWIAIGGGLTASWILNFVFHAIKG